MGWYHLSGQTAFVLNSAICQGKGVNLGKAFTILYCVLQSGIYGGLLQGKVAEQPAEFHSQDVEEHAFLCTHPEKVMCHVAGCTVPQSVSCMLKFRIRPSSCWTNYDSSYSCMSGDEVEQAGSLCVYINICDLQSLKKQEVRLSYVKST